MVPDRPATRAEGLAWALSGLAALSAVVAAVWLLFPRPLADVFFAGWVLVAAGLALVGTVAAWAGRTPSVWAAGLLLAAASVAGMWSIGLFYAPSALLLLLAAAVDQWWGPDRGKAPPVDGPPSVPAAGRRTAVGVALVVVGAGLVYQGVFAWELFARGCAAETLDCALAVTRWEAVGTTLVGLACAAVGAGLIWRRAAAGRWAAENEVG